MKNATQVLGLTLGSDKKIAPVDYASEVQTLTKILDYVEEHPHEASSLGLPDFGAVTPWIAHQLGCLTEKCASEGRLAAALVYAKTSVNAALSCRDADRIVANSLSLAGVHVRNGNNAAAARIYEEILELPFDQCYQERAMAHLSLASLRSSASRHREAVHHYEHAICCLGALIPESSRVTILRGIMPSYVELKDVVGLAFAGEALGIADSKFISEDFVVPALPQSAVVAAVTRLRKLGARELADQIFAAWSRPHQSGESHAGNEC
jgi:hypothetical protein